MKITHILIAIILSSFFLLTDIQSQDESKWSDLDKSPTDMAYYPDKAAWRNYLTGDDRNISPKMRIVYSRPSKNERAIFGELVPYGTEWRLGANEATEITFYQAVEIYEKRIPRGTYTLFATPSQSNWTLSLSSQTSLWGAEKRDPEKTVASFTVTPTQMQDVNENLSMAFKRVDDESAHLVIEWDQTHLELPIGFNPVSFEEMDVSPMDQVHYPETSAYHNYLKAEDLGKAGKKIRVIYARPQKKGRTIFGELLKYGEVWRVGANESTEITFYENVKINGESIRSGSYNLYAVVNEKSWDIILNTDRPAWGPPNRDESKDVATITLPVTMDTEDLEVLNIIFEEKTETEVHMVIAWEKHRMNVPITFEAKTD